MTQHPLQARMAALRALAHAPPSAAAWACINALTRAEDPEGLASTYARQHLAGWPAPWDALTAAPLDLSGADLRDASLPGADLSGCDLSSADLSGASLERANLTSADLSDAVLVGARLTHARLSGATLRGADLSRAALSGATFDAAHTDTQTPTLRVILHAPGAQPERHVFSHTLIKIGRLASCNLPVLNVSVSRMHAVIEPPSRESPPERWRLIDLGSALGTQVNGEDANTWRLMPGDRVVLGETVLLRCWPDTRHLPADLQHATFTDATFDRATAWPDNTPPPNARLR